MTATRRAADEIGAEGVRIALAREGVAYVSGFPVDAHELLRFLAGFGTPLEYYGGDAGTHPDGRAIWRVRYEQEASARGETHAVDGPLEVHSSQSLLDPRPAFFCMLMVDAGWQDQPEGNNGESLLARWSDALRFMAERDPELYARDRAVLFGDMPYPDGSLRCLAYELDTAKDEFDVGVRLKSDLLTYLQTAHAGSSAAAAVERLASAAARTARRVQLASGTLVIVDNDRWGHGRESVLGRRQVGLSTWVSNPRELWSLTLA